MHGNRMDSGKVKEKYYILQKHQAIISFRTTGEAYEICRQPKMMVQHFQMESKALQR